MSKNKTSKKMIVSSLAVVASASVFSGTQVAFADETTEQKSFSDLQKGDQGYEQVMALVNQGIIKGFEDNTFGPYKNVTRGQVAVMLTKALKLETPVNATEILKQYNDVDETSLYANEIAAVTEVGIFKGSNGNFNSADDITRSQAATVLVKAFGLKANDKEVNLFDINSIDDSHRENVKILAQNGITIGKVTNEGERFFDGKDELKRVQFAIFLDKAMNVEKVIENVTNEIVTIQGIDYKISEGLKGLFAEANKDALQNTTIEFEASEDNVITKVTNLELVNDGKADEALVLDAGNNVIAGNIVVSGDFVTVKNITVKGDLIVAGSDFSAESVSVEGNTVVGEQLKNTGAQIAATSQNDVVFTNSSLKVLEINGANINVLAKGTTAVSLVEVKNNAKITADETVVIPNVSISNEVTDVELNANVTNLEVNNEKEVAISGTADIDKLTVNANGQLAINIKGNIATLDTSVSNAKVTLNEETTVEQLLYLKDKEASDVIENYADVKEQINNELAVLDVVKVLNEANGIEAVGVHLETSELGLDLTDYNKLTDGGRKDAVAAALYLAVKLNGDFTNKAEIQAALDASVDNETHKMELIQLVNKQGATVADLTRVLNDLKTDAEEILNGYTEVQLAKLNEFYGEMQVGEETITLTDGMEQLIAEVEAYNKLSDITKEEVFKEFRTNEYNGSDQVALGYVKVAIETVKAEVSGLNSAQTTEEFQAAIFDSKLGLDFTAFNKLTDGGRKNAAIGSLIFAKELNGDFTSKAEVQAILDASVAQETNKMELIQLINKADGTVDDLTRVLNALSDDAEEVLNESTEEQLAAMDEHYSSFQQGETTLTEGMKQLVALVNGYNDLSENQKAEVFVQFQSYPYSGSDVVTLGYVKAAMDEVTVKEINNATAENMQAAIENSELGLDLTAYHKLTDGGRKGAVAHALLFAKLVNGDFANKAEVQAALDASVDNETHKMEIIQLVVKEEASAEDLTRILNDLSNDAEEILSGYTEEQLELLNSFYGSPEITLTDGMEQLMQLVESYNELADEDKQAVFTKFQQNEYSGSDVVALSYVKQAMDEVLATKENTETTPTVDENDAVVNGIIL